MATHKMLIGDAPERILLFIEGQGRVTSSRIHQELQPTVKTGTITDALARLTGNGLLLRGQGWGDPWFMLTPAGRARLHSIGLATG